MADPPVESTAVEEPQDTSESPQEAAGREERPEATSTSVPTAEGADAAAESPDDFKPAGGELAALDPQDVYRAMDRADEEQILDELQGRALDVMVYSFSQGGSKVTDLSYAGVSEAARTFNARGAGRIRVAEQPPQVEEFSEDGLAHYRVAVYALDAMTGGGRWGIATQAKRMKLKPDTARRYRKQGRHVDEDDRVWDQFALQKCLSKAQRNAMKPLLPIEHVQTLIAQYLGDESRVKRIQAGPGANPDLPPPLTDPRAEALKQRARELYDDLKELSRLVVTPAAFHQYLTRAEHSHERLEDFIGYLERKLDEQRAKEADGAGE